MKPDYKPNCPECACDGHKNPLTWKEGGNYCFVIWPIYSRYDWWKCRVCKQKFVTHKDGEPELAS